MTKLTVAERLWKKVKKKITKKLFLIYFSHSLFSGELIANLNFVWIFFFGVFCPLFLMVSVHSSYLSFVYYVYSQKLINFYYKYYLICVFTIVGVVFNVMSQNKRDMELARNCIGILEKYVFCFGKGMLVSMFYTSIILFDSIEENIS